MSLQRSIRASGRVRKPMRRPPEGHHVSIQGKERLGTHRGCHAYDYASLASSDEAGLDIVLVGDSSPGHAGVWKTPSHHHGRDVLYTRGVRRGLRRALLVADMPFAAYQADTREASPTPSASSKRQAPRPSRRGRAHRARRATHRGRGSRDGTIGLNPQAVITMGGFKVQGKTMQAVESAARGRHRLAAAGCFAIVSKASPRVARLITMSRHPTIASVQAQTATGQILVLPDLMTMTFFASSKVRPSLRRRGAIMRNAAHRVQARR